MKFPIFFLFFAFVGVCHGMDLESIKPSIVRLIVLGEGESGATGTGFVVATKNGESLVATNCHVVAERARDDSLIVARKNGDAVECGVSCWDLSGAQIPAECHARGGEKQAFCGVHWLRSRADGSAAKNCSWPCGSESHL